ncbi:multiple sugar transport system substrate-binding protein [Paenibacillus phyllosphaerae]|uniref:Multiple sugar transport system substrate-binding protein n=1 Tax=Paenibacillus phyllosphaerae TaxID=274593 RepID=A0A7W5FNP2_9BACL|nr:sugar ABC transporter substrate-binding protein [Paenibacillus phyllosphaerae]MBB3111520.1 multiple sugar transport system substrate-binding protein [Paenibacillus phyllosphaerae]
MSNKRKVIGSALIGALAVSLAGCSSGNSDAPNDASGEGKVVLEYYTWTDEEDYMKKVVEAFNAQHSDIEVHMNTISNNSDEYNTKIMNNLSGGSAMDVYSINGTSSLGLYASRNQLVDLTDRVKAANVDVGAYGPSYQDIIEVLTEGKYYALPYRTSQYALFYNKAIFDREGIPYPKQMTWEEYAELAKSLTKGEGADKQWGGYYADWLTAPLGALQQGTTLLDDSLDNVSSWLEYMDRLYEQDQSHMSYKQMKAESVDWIKQFESGNVAMLINGEWTVNMLKADIAAGKTDITFDMAPLPLPEGTTDPITVGGVSTFIGVNPSSKNADAAFEFARFVAGEEGESIVAESSVLPAYSSDKTKEAFLNATGIEGSGYFFEANTVIENQPVAQINEVNRIYGEQRDLFLFHEQDAAKAIANFMDQRKSVLNP